MSREASAAVIVAAFLLASCDVGEVIDSASGSDPPMGDVVIVMQPGDGRGERANELLAGFDDSVTDLVPGTANHLAFVETVRGRVDIVRFLADDPELGLIDCVFEIEATGGGGTCGGPPGDAAGVTSSSEGPDHNALTALVPAGTAEVRITTASGATVVVRPAGGVAHALWPAQIGTPATVEFVDSAGNVLGTERG